MYGGTYTIAPVLCYQMLLITDVNIVDTDVTVIHNNLISTLKLILNLFKILIIAFLPYHVQ